MGVTQSYSVGGWIDEVKKINFPPHLFPKLSTPFTKGLTMEIPPIPGLYSSIYKVEEDMELVNVALACSGYRNGDYWEVIIKKADGNEYKIVETMPTRELAESINLGNVLYIVYAIPAGSEIKFDFYNISGTSKTAWPSYRLLK